MAIGNSIFADGAGACIVAHAGFVGQQKSDNTTSANNCEWALGTFCSDIIPESAEAMTWKNSAEPGRYDMWLDRGIPKLLSGLFVNSGFSFIRRAGISNPFTCAWAIHPGGAAILTAFRTAFDTMHISGDGIAESTEVLRDYGNMSSATIFFVLQRLLSTTTRDEVFAAGFGPGLTIEFGRLYKVSRQPASEQL